MGRAADKAGIQFRILNRRKGPAVRGPRAQADRRLYRQAMGNLLDGQPGLTSRAGAVDDLVFDGGGRLAGVRTENGEEIRAATVVVTTGTFLRGLIHAGFSPGTPENRDAAAPGRANHRPRRVAGSTR
jgi:tRNA uridine 5-carboxymethylaminomethyl modification enzyme